MDLSVSLFIATSFAILCTFYIGKRILTIDFSEYSSKNSKKAKKTEEKPEDKKQ